MPGVQVVPAGGGGHPVAVPSELLRALCDAVEAYKRRTAETDEVIAARAGILRAALSRVMRKGREGVGEVELGTAERIARAIGWRLRLEPDPEAPPEE